MDTESELGRDAAAPHTPLQYACSIQPCDSAKVDDIADLTPCEKCKRMVCEGHARKRSVFYLCSDCDRKERVSLETFILPELDKVAHLLRTRSITAEELQFQLAALENQASDIEGEA